MKFFLSARYGRRLEMLNYTNVLKEYGHENTSRWIYGDNETVDENPSVYAQFIRQCAIEDIEDVLAADAIICFTELLNVPGRSRGGRHVELGIALSNNKQIYVVGPRENVFHYLPQVKVFNNFYDIVAPVHA